MPRVPLCPHGNLVDDCEWCSPSRIVQDAPPHILADLGAREISNGPIGTDEPHAHV
jgi:hypothetical protein